MSAMPVMIVVLCLGAIAYRYYSAFLAAKVLALDPAATTPAHKFDDGQNFHPTSKWVLFGHHFAAISGAGPLIGPVLAAQFGYLPGLIWIVVGVCLAGAVQDFLVLAMSTRHEGRSLGQIAYAEINKTAGTAATVAILAILVIAIAGLGKVVVKALGGEEVKYPAGSAIILPQGLASPPETKNGIVRIPAGSMLWYGTGQQMMTFSDPFDLKVAATIAWDDPGPRLNAGPQADKQVSAPEVLAPRAAPPSLYQARLPPDAVRLVRGSPWGVFTIACTIPIALLVGLWMYRIRRGRVVEASLIGGALTLAATVAGGYLSRSSHAHWFDLSGTEVTWWMAGYGFVAAVLPVWVLLVPRDYLSSFLKIGTIALLVVGVLIANPKLEAPAFNHVFTGGGPIVRGAIFPFLFITIMCGAISGFHALISSGTSSKMISNETHARTVGYGAMLVEGLVAVVAMIAAASLSPADYYAMNTSLAAAPQFHERILAVGGGGGVEHLATYESLTEESLRGRVGGAVTLAVGMAHIFDTAARSFSSGQWLNAMWKYWYHFAIMFEALFILTTIDAGTRVGRFLLQEVAGKVHPKLGLKGGATSAVACTAAIVLAWVYMLGSGPFDLIWAIFGVANQSLAVIALGVVTAWLVNTGRGRYAWVTIAPMAVVYLTTSSAAVALLNVQINGVRVQISNAAVSLASWRAFWASAKPLLANAQLFNLLLQVTLILAMMLCTLVIVASVALTARRRPTADAPIVATTVGAID